MTALTNEQEVAEAVEQLRMAMVEANGPVLENLAGENLSYGHSNGYVETKPAFVQNIVSGKSDFVSIQLSEQSIVITHNTAVVRHLFDAATNDGGNPGSVKLFVLLVWQKENDTWKLLARQAVRRAS